MSLDFLAALHPMQPGTREELRMIRNGKVEQAFYPVEGLGGSLVADAKEADAEGWDCYIGVLPRLRDSGKAEDTTPTTTVLWADLDTKNLGGSHMASFLALQRAGLEPSILVDSGNGLHAYWLLRQPVPFAKASVAMQGLHKLIGSDSVHDAPRVLRLPGTRNHKACFHDVREGAIEKGLIPPNDPAYEGRCKPVRLLKLDPDRTYRWADFVDFAIDFVEQQPPRPRRDNYDLGKQEYHALPDWLREAIEQGAPEGERSEAIWKVCCNLLERGWEDDEIEALFQVMPIGEKVQEMPERAATRYMRRTLDRAREVIE